MKAIDINSADLAHALEEAQGERLLVTRQGKPLALVYNVEDLDIESIETASDPAFWKMITERRQPGRKTRSLAEVRAALALPSRDPDESQR